MTDKTVNLVQGVDATTGNQSPVLDAGQEGVASARYVYWISPDSGPTLVLVVRFRPETTPVVMRSRSPSGLPRPPHQSRRRHPDPSLNANAAMITMATTKTPAAKAAQSQPWSPRKT
jgi:hypothetical protein